MIARSHQERRQRLRMRVRPLLILPAPVLLAELLVRPLLVLPTPVLPTELLPITIPVALQLQLITLLLLLTSKIPSFRLSTVLLCKSRCATKHDCCNNI